MADESDERQPELTPAERRLLQGSAEIRGYSPRTQVVEPTRAPAGRASASPGSGPADAPEADGDRDEAAPPHGD
ncbi:hypothetical protein GCM10010449_64440 [Streptomyces rectiviolaceus]|uniref:Uncharacterized protein n=1 Tax=Streptomyces rectiviolaceus TaxID=332591 RepID=A0ABP6N319_9ACTN